MRTLKIRPTQPQADFHNLNCKFPAFVGGFGTGKSETLANQAIMDASHSSSALIGIYEPSHDLLKTVIIPRMEEKLIDFGIPYKYNKTDKTILTSSNQFGDFIFRSMDDPSKIVGYETYRSHIDELDTLKKDKAKDVWIKVIGRNRQKLPEFGNDTFNRVSAYCTPEGFNFMYDRWVLQKSANYSLIQASTRSNPFLPDDYVETIIDSYPAQLIDAYLEGRFVNLTSGTVYNSFDRAKNGSSEQVEGNEHLYIGLDFNVGKMAASIFVRRGQEWHAVGELFDCLDTPDIINAIKNKYPNNKITVYPDSSGKNRKTVGASETDISLLKDSDFIVRAKKANPLVKDRVNCVNLAFEQKNVFVNVDNCPEIVRCLEQQSYDKNGQPDKASGNDHMNDGVGYLISYELPINKPFYGTM